VNGVPGRGALSLARAVQELYSQGQSDYSFEPVVLVDGQGSPIGCIQDGDAVIFCCRRGERETQLTEAFTDPDLNRFPRRQFQNLPFVILTLYHEKFKDLPVAFAPRQIQDTLGETVSQVGLRQLRVSESEKFAHVTFFFNGGRSRPFPGEVDICVPSPKGIPYDRIPELSLAQVCRQVMAGIAAQYDLIVTNFANGDAIGHTQSRQAKIECAQLVDTRLGQVIDASLAAGYVTLVTADHGNLEELFHPDGSPHVSHTSNPVPFISIDPRSRASVNLRPGRLADIAPTILQALGLPLPELMEGSSLTPESAWGGERRVLLVILDGWGIGSHGENNPIYLAPTPVWDSLTSCYPFTQLQAAGEAVGLQAGKAGNSEAGHMNIGAGRVVLQDDARLDHAMQDGSFYTNEILCSTIQEVKQRGGRLHLIGLLSEKSSHGSIEYPLALLRMAKAHDLQDVFLHVIFDGRSTEPGSAPEHLHHLEHTMMESGAGRVASGMGRAIALDRDGNYDKTGRAYNALVFGEGKKYPAG
jgi:2,3-bisphosphoglycerate-independent phosphoglycerate mutase